MAMVLIHVFSKCLTQLSSAKTGNSYILSHNCVRSYFALLNKSTINVTFDDKRVSLN